MSWWAKAPLIRCPQDVEETQLAALRAEVGAGKAALQQAEQQYAELKGTLATVYQALGPQVGVRHQASMNVARCGLSVHQRPKLCGHIQHCTSTCNWLPVCTHANTFSRCNQALAAAFGYSEQLLSGFNASAASYGAVADRLLSGRVVAAEDGEAVVARVRELLTQVRLGPIAQDQVVTEGRLSSAKPWAFLLWPVIPTTLPRPCRPGRQAY